MNDAERLKAMYALLSEAVAWSTERGHHGGPWIAPAELALADYRMSRPDTRTGLARKLSPGWEPKRAGSTWTCTHETGDVFDCWPGEDVAWERYDEHENAACEKHAESMGVFAGLGATPTVERKDD